MVNVLLFIEGQPVQIIHLPARIDTMSYVYPKGTSVTLPVEVVMFTLPNGKVAAVRVASDRIVSSGEALNAYLQLVTYQL